MKKFVLVASSFLLLFFSSCTTQPRKNLNGDLVEKPVTLSWYVNFSWFETPWGEDPTSREISKRSGIEVKYASPGGNETEKLMSMIASRNLPDLLTMGWWENAYHELIAQDMLAPLNELAQEFDPSFFDVAEPSRLQWYTHEDGKVYGYPNASYSTKDYVAESNQTFLVRKDIYEAIGSPDMTTPEGFLKALADAKERFPLVDGEPLIPLGLQEFNEIGNSSLEEYLQNFLAIPFEKDGLIYDRFTDPDYLQWLKTFRRANEQGLIMRDVFVDKRIQMEEKIAKKRYFAMLYQWSDCQTQLKNIYAETPSECYIAVDGPKNAKGEPHRLNGPGIQGWTLTMISKDSPYKSQAIQLLSFLMSDQGQKLIWAGVEGQSYDVLDGRVVFKDEMLSLLASNRSRFDQTYGAAATHWMLMDNAYAQRQGYKPPDDDYIESIKRWSTQYAVNFSAYMFGSFAPGTPEAYAKSRLDTARGAILPQLILAGSEEEFDKLVDGFLKERKEDYALVQKEYQKKLSENKKRLGL